MSTPKPLPRHWRRHEWLGTSAARCDGLMVFQDANGWHHGVAVKAPCHTREECIRAAEDTNPLRTCHCTSAAILKQEIELAEFEAAATEATSKG